MLWCAERLREKGAEEGDFLVRARNGEQADYALTIMYKGRPTHHVLRADETGVFTVNKLPCGGARSVVAAIDYFSVPVQGWPVVLKRGIPRDADVPSPAAPLPSPTTLVARTPQPAPAPVSSVPLAAPTTAVPSPIVVRRASLVTPDVVNNARRKSEAVHQQIDSDFVNLNARVDEEEQKRKEELRAARISKTRHSVEDEEFDGFGDDDKLARKTTADRLNHARRASAALAWDEREELAALARAAVVDMARILPVEHDPNNPSYLWRVCTKQRSAELLSGRPDGTFLMRRPPPTITPPVDPGTFLLDIVFKGKLTTHAVSVVPPPPSTPTAAPSCTLNGRSVARCDTIDDLIFRLKRPLNKWPVVLGDAVPDPSKCRPRAPGAGSGERDRENPTYLFPPTPRTEVVALLEGEPDGTFHVRPQHVADSDRGAPGTRAFLLCVQFRGTTTQHSIERSPPPSGPYTVNGKPMGGLFTLDELIEYLRAPRKNWPVRLTNALRPPGVVAPDSSPDPVLSNQIRRDASDVQARLAVATETLAAAQARLDAVAAGDRGDRALAEAAMFALGNDARAALAELDKRAASAEVEAAERVLEAKTAALQELRQ